MSIRVTKDGRTITGFRNALWFLQKYRCFDCGRMTSYTVELFFPESFHVHHKNGRGMGGGKRDDSFESCKGLCGLCHRKEHGQ